MALFMRAASKKPAEPVRLVFNALLLLPSSAAQNCRDARLLLANSGELDFSPVVTPTI